MGEHASQRTSKDIEALVELFNEKDEIDDVYRFEEAPDNPFPLVDIRLGPRFDRLVDHGWVEVDPIDGEVWFTYSGYAIGRYGSRKPEKIKELSVPEFVSKAGSKVGLKLS